VNRSPTIVAVIVGVLVLTLAACSSSSPTVNAEDASAQIVQQWHFPTEVEPCLTSTLADDEAARRALDAQSAPADGDLDALSSVITECVPGPTFAAAITPGMVDGYTSVGATIDASNKRCLQDQMAALFDEDRGLIVTGPISQMRDPTSERSTAVSDVLHRLLDTCGIDLTAAPATSGTLP
jgi:hypothetical protein